jgi:hypothetical protein
MLLNVLADISVVPSFWIGEAVVGEVVLPVATAAPWAFEVARLKARLVPRARAIVVLFMSGDLPRLIRGVLPVDPRRVRVVP